MRLSGGCGTDDCGRTSAPSRPSMMPSPPSTRPSDARGRRSSAFVRERRAPKVEDGRVVLLHTEVPQELSGLGYGARLAHGVFEALRCDGKRVIAKCPFMSSYAARHSEYGALLDG